MNPKLFNLIISIMFILFIFVLLTCIIIEIINDNNTFTISIITIIFPPIIAKVFNK